MPTDGSKWSHVNQTGSGLRKRLIRYKKTKTRVSGMYRWDRLAAFTPTPSAPVKTGPTLRNYRYNNRKRSDDSSPHSEILNEDGEPSGVEQWLRSKSTATWPTALARCFCAVATSPGLQSQLQPANPSLPPSSAIVAQKES